MDDAKIRMVVIDRTGVERAIEAASGLSLMEAIRENGIDELEAMCGGCCSCATCHVYGDPPAVFGVPSPDEEDLLEGSSHRTGVSRLSCQVRLTSAFEGLRVTIAPED